VRRAIVAPGALDIELGGACTLDGEVAHYVRDVLRLRAGDALELCDGRGRVVRGVLGRGATSVQVEAVHDEPEPAGPTLTLHQAIGKGDKLDQVFRAATELGARRLVPVRTARAVADRSGRADRWQTIVEDAIRVSGRAWAPVLEPIVGLDEVLRRPRAALSLALDGGGTRTLHEALVGAPASVEVLVGPEGGFTDEERAALEAHGWTRVTLGQHTLRTETAGAAIVAIVQHVLGAVGSALPVDV
jgi:16S rRNA (uracil1498-N3)-methyltransferase